MGDKSADLILSNCSLVNVYTNEIQEKIQIAIKKDRIAYVGPNASHAKGSTTKVIISDSLMPWSWLRTI